MTVFHWTPEPWQHTWVVECLLALKTDIYKDVLIVIAMGTSESRFLLLLRLPLLLPLTRASFSQGPSRQPPPPLLAPHQ